MVPHTRQAEGLKLSLRRRVRRYCIEEKRLHRIARGLLFHAVIALPLDALLKWLGVPAFAAIRVATSVAVTIEVATTESMSEDRDG